MHFGQNIAPQVFQRCMDKILRDLKDFCVVYIDNILVFSKTIEEHKKHLKIICEKFQKNGIIISKKD
jgi:arabinogalactan endo-1,4-beta-galactosidase